MTLRRLASSLPVLLAVCALAGAQATKDVDPNWQKTSNQNIEGTVGTAAMGTTAKPITDPYWIWTATVWDGTQQNGYGTTIPGWVPGDYWARWPANGSYLLTQWFKTEVDICNANLLTSVKLVNKYCPGCPAGSLTINDDLYVWVNETRAAAGGTAVAAGYGSKISTSDFSALFVPAVRAGAFAIETDRWFVSGGLSLPVNLFKTGPNSVWVLADEFNGWGGLGHLAFKVTESSACKIVEIDIKPNSYPNCFNINGHGVVPVAILGSGDLNVFDIDVTTLNFAGLEVKVQKKGTPMCGYDDVNADGMMDLVCQFFDDPTLWQGGADTANLTGQMNDGSSFRGTDNICIVPE